MSSSTHDPSSTPSGTSRHTLSNVATKFNITLGDAILNLPGDTIVDFVRCSNRTQCQAEFKPGDTGPSSAEQHRFRSDWSRFRTTARSILRSTKSAPSEAVPSCLYIRIPEGISDLGSMQFDCKGNLMIRGTEEFNFNIFGVETQGSLEMPKTMKAKRANLECDSTLKCGDLDAKSYQLEGKTVEVQAVYPEDPGRSTINGKHGVNATMSAPKSDINSSLVNVDKTSKVSWSIPGLFEVKSWLDKTIVNGKSCGRRPQPGWKGVVDNPRCVGQLYIVSENGRVDVSFATGSEPGALLLRSEMSSASQDEEQTS